MEIEGKTIEWIYDDDTPVIVIAGKRGTLYFTEEGAKKLRDELTDLLNCGPEVDE